MSVACARPAGNFLGGMGLGVGCQQQGSRARVRVRARAAAAAAAMTMYEVLAVDEAAGSEEIKAAYRRAARRWHPDACPGGADRFMRAREAYEVLSDPERRRGYDVQLRCAGGGGSRAAGFADWVAQLAGLQWRAAERGAAGEETWGSRMRRAASQPSSY